MRNLTDFKFNPPFLPISISISKWILIVILALVFAGCEEPDDFNHPHEWGDWTVTIAPTCITDGEEERVCSLNPSHTETQIIPAYGHDWDRRVITAATETEDGSEDWSCRNDPAHNGIRTAYATGTAGLSFEAVGSPVTAYRVKRGSVKTDKVYIPAYHRSENDSEYVPVEIGSMSDPQNGGAFFNAATITSIHIPEGVRSIGSYAFYNCIGLTSIEIPASVTSIGYRAFSGCTSLTAINVAIENPDFSSDEGILYNKARTSLIAAPGKMSGNITIPARVTAIGDGAFSGCTGLTGVTIPAGVTSIGQGAFHDCTGLTSVTIPASVTYIGKNAFSGCKGLTDTITIPAGVTSIEEGVFSGCSSLAGITFTQDNLLETIGAEAFSGCKSLTRIDIPATVTTIGKGAFRDCTGLTRIIIPLGVTFIDIEVFDGCTNLTEIDVGAANSYYSSEGGVLYNKAKTTLIKAPAGISGSVTIPESVTAISQSAFYECTSLENVTLPKSLTSIGNYAFYKCTSIASITIPENVKAVGLQAFYHWTAGQKINVEGHNSREVSERAWDSKWWWDGCFADIKYLGA